MPAFTSEVDKAWPMVPGLVCDHAGVPDVASSPCNAWVTQLYTNKLANDPMFL